MPKGEFPIKKELSLDVGICSRMALAVEILEAKHKRSVSTSEFIRRAIEKACNEVIQDG